MNMFKNELKTVVLSISSFGQYNYKVIIFGDRYLNIESAFSK